MCPHPQCLLFDCTQHLVHTRQVLHHWATCPVSLFLLVYDFFLSFILELQKSLVNDMRKKSAPTFNWVKQGFPVINVLSASVYLDSLLSLWWLEPYLFLIQNSFKTGVICGKVKAVHCFVNLKKLISCSAGDYTYNHSVQEAEQEDRSAS